MNSDTGDVRPLTLSEATAALGERLPSGEVVVSHKVAAKLRKLRRYDKVAARRKMAKASRRVNRGS